LLKNLLNFVSLVVVENDSPPTPSRLPFLFVGLLIGLFLATFFWVLVKDDGTSEKGSEKPNVLSLNINTPTENLATSQKTLTVAGSTGIKSVVTVTGPSETKIIDASSETFSTTLELTEGKNIIDIVVYDPKSGSSVHETREVLFLNEDLSSL